MRPHLHQETAPAESARCSPGPDQAHRNVEILSSAEGDVKIPSISQVRRRVEAACFPILHRHVRVGLANLVTVVRGLVWAVDGDVEVLGLSRGEHGELHVELLEVSAGDLLVELLREHVDAESKLLGRSPESDLGQDLVGERAGHDERGVTGGAAGKPDEMHTVK